MSKKISISLPNQVFMALERVSREQGKPRSVFVAEAIRRQLGIPEEEPRTHPTALWELKVRGKVSLRSPKLLGRRIDGDWVIESAT